MEDEWKSREVVLKTKFKEERDEELDRAVERLEQEVTKGRKEVEQEYQERIRYMIYTLSYKYLHMNIFALKILAS